MTGTPSQLTHIRSQIEQRDLQMQTAFPAKVLSWTASTNTVKLEPQFLEVWRDGESRMSEPVDRPEDAYIDNVPVLFPRSGTWSITFPIVNGTFGLVLCTKYSLDVWRKGNGKVVDPGDLRRFTMSGAVFFPVNLHPDASTLSEIKTPNAIDPAYMILGQGGAVDFVALAQKVKNQLDILQAAFDIHEHASFGTPPTPDPPTIPIGSNPSWNSNVASSKVKVQ
jgi:hypothetical protein